MVTLCSTMSSLPAVSHRRLAGVLEGISQGEWLFFANINLFRANKFIFWFLMNYKYLVIMKKASRIFCGGYNKNCDHEQTLTVIKQQVTNFRLIKNG